MVAVTDAVHHRVAQLHVLVLHVDLGPQTCAPSANSPARIRRNRSRFSSTRGCGTDSRCPGSRSRRAAARDRLGVWSSTYALPCGSAARPTRRAARSNRRRRTAAGPVEPSQARSSMDPVDVRDVFGVGFVSSKRRLQMPPNSAAMPKSSRSPWRGRCAGIPVGLRREPGMHPPPESASLVVALNDSRTKSVDIGRST